MFMYYQYRISSKRNMFKPENTWPRNSIDDSDSFWGYSSLLTLLSL